MAPVQGRNNTTGRFITPRAGIGYFWPHTDGQATAAPREAWSVGRVIFYLLASVAISYRVADRPTARGASYYPAVVAPNMTLTLHVPFEQLPW